MSTNDFDKEQSLMIAKTLGLDYPDDQQSTQVANQEVQVTQPPETVIQPWYTKYTEAEIEELKRKAESNNSTKISAIEVPKVEAESTKSEESIIDRLIREANEQLQLEINPVKSEPVTQSEPEKNEPVDKAGEEWGRRIAKVSLQSGHDAKKILETLGHLTDEELVGIAAFKLRSMNQEAPQAPVAKEGEVPEMQIQIAEAKSTTVGVINTQQPVKQKSTFY